MLEQFFLRGCWIRKILLRGFAYGFFQWWLRNIRVGWLGVRKLVYSRASASRVPEGLCGEESTCNLCMGAAAQEVSYIVAVWQMLKEKHVVFSLYGDGYIKEALNKHTWIDFKRTAMLNGLAALYLTAGLLTVASFSGVCLWVGRDCFSGFKN